MIQRTGLRTSTVLAAIVAFSGIAYAAGAASTGASRVNAVEVRAVAPKAYTAVVNPQILQAVLNALKSKDQGLLQNAITKTLKTKADQTLLQQAAVSGLTAAQNRAKVNSVIANGLTAVQNRAKVNSVIANGLTAVQNRAKVNSVIANAFTAVQNQAKVNSVIANALTAVQNQAKVNSVIANALTATQNQAVVATELTKQIATAGIQQALKNVAASQGFLQQTQLPAQVANQLQQTATTNLLTQTLNLNNYVTQSQAGAFVQGQGKVFTGQATSAGSTVTVLTVPGLLHVSAIWWPSDGTVQFEVFNDSGGTLDFGGDVSGFFYQDQFSSLNQDIGTLQTPQADGTIAPGNHEDFQITPRPDNVDLPSQQVPYRAEAHIQVTAPGSQLATLDLSAFEIAQNGGSPGVGGSALVSGQAVVAPA